MRVEKAAESFREGNLLKESLPIIIFGIVGILWSEHTLFSLLSPTEDENKALGKGFLEAKEAEIFLEEYLAIQQVWGLSLEWTHLLVLELVLKRRFRESRNSLICCELF